MKPKNPRTNIGPLTAEDSDFISFTGALHRIYRTTGDHRQRWDQMRVYGPLRTARWDPHPEPPGEHPDMAVTYLATGHAVTSFAEVFQARRAITLSQAHTLASWIPTRPLTLLNLTPPEGAEGVPWATRNGASGSLPDAPKNTCRAWAQKIRETWSDLDGLYVPSTITWQPMVVLYKPAADAFRTAPDFARPLTHPGLAALVAEIARQLGWPIRMA